MKTARYTNKNIDPNKHICIRISQRPPRFKLPYKISGVWRNVVPTQEVRNIKEESAYKKAYFGQLDRSFSFLGRQALFTEAYNWVGENIVLLCYEDIRKPGVFCHRRLLAEWLFGNGFLPYIMEEIDEEIDALESLLNPIDNKENMQ